MFKLLTYMTLSRLGYYKFEIWKVDLSKIQKANNRIKVIKM